MIVLAVQIVPTPSEDESTEFERDIRDEKDRTILRAAMAAGADIIITGDRDFLESGIKKPRMMTATEFLERAD